MNGVLNLYKPKGVTSHDCVAAVRRILRTRAVGHMGTLDPAGEGVLLIGVGKCTRLFDFFLGHDKEYEAAFTFGYVTDTLDGDGKITASGGRIPTEESLTAALEASVGTVAQIPPAYSAKSVNGVRAYALARQGAAVELTPKTIEIFSLALVSYAPPVAVVRVRCSAGTYIRSLCRDLAESLGTLATMTAIRRIRCGAYTADEAVTLKRLELLGEKALIPPETALKETARFTADDAFYAKLSNGVKTNVGAPEGVSALYCRGELFGLAETKDGVTRIRTNLRA